MLLEAVDRIVLAIADQTQGQFVALEQDGVGVLLLLCNGVSEGAERLLADNSTIGEPFPVRLDSCAGDIAALVASGFRDLAICVSLRLALFEDVELLDLLCVSVEVFAGDDVSRNRSRNAKKSRQEKAYPLILKVAPPVLVPSRARRLFSFLKLPILASAHADSLEI